MTWLLPILRHRVTRGVGIALGGLIAIAWHGKNKYREGYRDGFTTRAADAQKDALIAKAAADSAWAVLYAQAADAREAEREARNAASRARARSAAAEARLADALARFHADTLPQTPACGELATACANAAALWSVERDSLTRVVTVADSTATTLRAMVGSEPTRRDAAVRVALEQQRATFRAPSRVKWLLSGMVTAVVTIGTLGVLR